MSKISNRILTYLDSLPGKIRLLEIGCGRCDLFEILNQSHELEYYGVERNKNLYQLNLSKFGHLGNFRIYKTGSDEKTMWTPFINKEPFDVIVIRGTLEKLSSHDACLLITYAKFFLKSTGFFIVSKNVFNFRWLLRYFETTLGSCTVEYIPLSSVLLVAGQ